MGGSWDIGDSASESFSATRVTCLARLGSGGEGGRCWGFVNGLRVVVQLEIVET